MNKTKFLMVVPMLHQGGFERVCVRTARIMEPWFDVTIAIFSDKDIAYDISGLKVVNLDVPAVDNRLGKLLNVWKRIRRLKKLKKEIRPDISYSFGLTANLVNVLTPTGEKIWSGIRSYMDMDAPRKLKLFCSRSHKVICCSKVIAKELEEKFRADNTEVLYNPFDIAQMEQLAECQVPDMPDLSREKVIVSVGREDDVKEFWHLIKALSLVVKKVPSASLLIVGEGDFAEYKQLAKELGLEDKVYFPGVLKNLFPWLKKSTLYVGVSAMEGFPNALVEGMSTGLPCLFTNCMTGPAEILSDDLSEVFQKEELIRTKYGVLLPNMNPVKNLDPGLITEEEKALAKIITEFLEDEKLCSAYGQAAKERAQVFSFEAYKEQLLSFAAVAPKDML